jgi:hypothetical protein
METYYIAAAVVASASAGAVGEAAGAFAAVALEKVVARILNASADDHNTLAVVELVGQEEPAGVRVNQNYSSPSAYACAPESEPQLGVDTMVVDAGVGGLHTRAAAVAVVEVGYTALVVPDRPAVVVVDVAAVHTPVPN